MDIFDPMFVFNVLMDNENVLLRDKKTLAKNSNGIYTFYNVETNETILKTSNREIAYREFLKRWQFNYN